MAYLSFLFAGLGIWLMAAPAVLGYVGTAAATNDRVVGPFIATFFIISFNQATRNVRYWNVPLGLWMVAAAFAFDYPSAGMLSAILVGLATTALPFLPRPTTATFAGGWTVLAKTDPYGVRRPGHDADHPGRAGPPS